MHWKIPVARWAINCASAVARCRNPRFPSLPRALPDLHEPSKETNKHAEVKHDFFSEDVLASSRLFFRDFGLDEREFQVLVKAVPEILKPGLKDDLTPLICKLNRCNVRQKGLKYLVRRHGKLLAVWHKSRLQENIDYLYSIGLNEEQIGKTVRHWPAILVQKVEELMLGVTFLKEIGISQENISYVVCMYPCVLHYNIDGVLRPKVNYFQTLGLERCDIAKMIECFPILLGHSVELNIKPAVAILKKAGLEGTVLAKFISSFPYIFGMNNNKVEEILSVLKGLHDNPVSLAKALCWGCEHGVDALKYKFQFLENQGLSAADVESIIKAEPHVLRVENNVLQMKIEFALNIIGCSVNELVNNPSYFNRNVMERVKIRFRWLYFLKTKEVYKRKIRLWNLVNLREHLFLKYYVKPYPQWEHGYESSKPGRLQPDVAEKCKIKRSNAGFLRT